LWEKRREREEEEQDKAFVFFSSSRRFANQSTSSPYSSSNQIFPAPQFNFTVVEAPVLTQLDAMEAVARW